MMIRRARIHGPSEMLAHLGISSPETYRVAAERQASLYGRTVTPSDMTLHAYVNHGRWVADCPLCNSGIAVEPGWPIAYCLGVGCHAAFSHVELPRNWREVERLLLLRPVLLNRNFRLHETTEHLRHQNIANGVGT